MRSRPSTEYSPLGAEESAAAAAIFLLRRRCKVFRVSHTACDETAAGHSMHVCAWHRARTRARAEDGAFRAAACPRGAAAAVRDGPARRTSSTNHGQSYETPRTSCRRPSSDNGYPAPLCVPCSATGYTSSTRPCRRSHLSSLARLVVKRCHAADQLCATEPACALPRAESGRDGRVLLAPAVCAAKTRTTLAYPPAHFTRVDTCETHTESCSQRGRPCGESPQFAPGAG